MMNDFQKKSLGKALRARPYLVPLAKRLASIGGDTPVIWNDDELTSELFVAMLLLFGHVSSGKDARLQRMESSACHANSIKLARKDLNLHQREMGFALSADGCWRPHSWVWDSTKNQIVETTELRNKYFGVTHALSRSEQSSKRYVETGRRQKLPRRRVCEAIALTKLSWDLPPSVAPSSCS
jgi:hypothetical protein